MGRIKTGAIGKVEDAERRRVFAKLAGMSQDERAGIDATLEKLVAIGEKLDRSPSDVLEMLQSVSTKEVLKLDWHHFDADNIGKRRMWNFLTAPSRGTDDEVDDDTDKG